MVNGSVPGLLDGGLLGNGGIGGTINEITGQPVNRGDGTFRKVLTESDLVDDGKSITAGDYSTLGDPGFKVPAQELYRWGFGSAKFEANQGYMYVQIEKDAGGGEQEGVLRIQQRDAQQRNIVTVLEERTNVLAGSETDRTMKQPLPEQREYPKVGRDSYLNLAMNPDATFTIGTATGETTVLLPVTVYPV